MSFTKHFGKNIIEKEKGLAFGMPSAEKHTALRLGIFEGLLVLGIGIMFLEYMNFFAQEKFMFGLTFDAWSILIIGLLMNFFCIPMLYVSSYKNFSNDNASWDRETFWIVPLFLFGSFSVYRVGSVFSIIFFILSLMVIVFFHFYVFLKSRRVVRKNIGMEMLNIKDEYYMTLNYIFIYYILCISLMVYAINPSILVAFKQVLG